MPTCDGFAATERAARYLNQLCKHMTGHGMHVETPDETYGFADFGFGTCTLRAQPDGLAMTLQAQQPVALERAQHGLTRELERFGRRDGLTVTWGPTTQSAE